MLRLPVSLSFLYAANGMTVPGMMLKAWRAFFNFCVLTTLGGLCFSFLDEKSQKEWVTGSAVDVNCSRLCMGKGDEVINDARSLPSRCFQV